MKNATSQKFSVVETTTLHVRLEDSRVRAASGLVRSLAEKVLLGISYINRFLKFVFPPERKISSCIFKPAPILAIRTCQKNTGIRQKI